MPLCRTPRKRTPPTRLQTKKQVHMKTTVRYYLRTASGRIKLVKLLGRFAVTGGLIISAVLLIAAYLNGKAS